MSAREPHGAAAQIVRDAGGELVGRTRLQKVAFLMELAGFGADFPFEYHHFGPYSEDLAQAMDIAVALGPVSEEERVAEWGGKYSIFTLSEEPMQADPDRAGFVQEAKSINAVELELAATAAYLFVIEGIGRSTEGNPWLETRRRKPSKAAEGRLESAAAAYQRLREIPTPKPLPELPTLVQ